MKNAILRTLFCLFATVGLSSFSASATDDINFTNARVDEAIKKAGKEGKLVFLDFYASWCAPCKWMEKTTFKDNQVVDRLNSNYISIKVNIDEVHGFEMKNKYEIAFLPTILIINSNGKMVERIEEPVTAGQLNGILDFHNSPENKVVVLKHEFNKSPKNIDDSNDSLSDPWKISTEDYRKYKDEEKRRNYKLQVGVYTSYNKAEQKVEDLRDTFLEQVMVLNEYKDSKVLFKVMLGQFDTISEAESFRKILKNQFQMDAIIY